MFASSIILNTDAPCSAALARKPARKLWPAKVRGSRPARVAWCLTISAAMKGESEAAETRSPFSTGRKIGPVVIEAAASQVCRASTGQSR
jgi:hypothetical protein